ncbi:TetR/AcrR family transcriptional regulator [Staphylococcus coagulans]|uniref:TetR/AcrR family transcriptional regulator n=1 Tax=Staphylococcus coagulans TaxID=74706 RepID=UPI000CD0B1B9|nr:TetR/AcrR family transcriptional regulator [Staphylococcus coagulans]PNZ09687.1 TetR/AcrR family transcriptional regulator [Staphylococcus coagulans]
MNKQDLRVIKTQNALMNAFTELLKVKEFEHITIQDLCDYALIRRSTFYRHYKDKYHLLNHAIENVLNRFRQIHLSDIRFEDPKPFLERYIHDLLTFINDNKVIVNSVVTHHLYDETSRIIYEQIYQAINKQTQYDIQTGARLDLDPTIYNHFLTGGVLSVVFNWSRDAHAEQTLTTVKNDIVNLICGMRETHLKRIN